MSAEDREARAAELERGIAREWLRFVIAEALVFWPPVALFVLVYATTDAIPDGWLVQLAVVGGVLYAAFVVYWVLKRIRPMQVELDALRAAR
jgi:hypothetical protein